ncbi:TraR/DksA C4-type zinc finger protein [Pelotomaculum schinkii]|uniref:TraR/DksA C4-type zinc finger protein n=1 Tax=Pelotomaculum schinkii TaxID=78350 RepID=UPI001FA98788|nr:TraR/DksA C4-type zinc finger protein [Pelotomaculum schinkii]
MDKAMLMGFKKRLLEERKNLLGRINFIDERGLGEALEDSISELSTYDNHPADIGTEVFERSKDFALRESAMISVAAVDDALNRINEGTYGVCDVCGKEIALERLEALPSTTICRDCKEAEEKIPRRDERPAEEDVLAKPFARSFTDASGNIEYDGEDAWQEVARYSETTDEWSRGGSYYGYSEYDIVEDRGAVEEVDNIPYEVGDDGVFYKDFRGVDDESSPAEKIDVGVEHT